MSETAEEHAIERGREAWKRLKNDSTWEDWMMVGDALDIGRVECMREAHTNQPLGRGYNEAFSRWKQKHGFADIDKGTLSRLSECIENRAAIEEYRATLPLSERLRLNHPNGVIRKWRAAVVACGKGSSNATAAALKQKIANLEAEIGRLKAAGGDLFSASDSARDIARVLFDTLGERKLGDVLKLCYEMQIEQGVLTDERLKQIKSDAKAAVVARHQR